MGNRGQSETSGYFQDEMFSSRSSKDCQERNAELCLENSVVQPLLTDLYQITMVSVINIVTSVVRDLILIIRDINSYSFKFSF